MILIIFLIILLLFAPYIAVRHNRVQTMTLFLGKLLAKKDIGDDYATLMSNRGLQDAITPKSQKWYLYSMILSWIVILISAFFIAWYVVIIAFVIYFIVYAVYSRIVNNKQIKYATILMNDLANRSADYKKSNDKDRADAAATFRDKIEQYIVSIRKENPNIPDNVKVMGEQ